MKAPAHRWVLTVVIATATPLVPRSVEAAPQVLADPEARAHFEQAQGYFDQEDYAAAIPELKAAYALEPNPMLLYAWAQAERLAGSCARAVDLYRRFLDTEPSPEQRQLAEANLVDCEAELPESSARSPDPADDPMDDLGAMEDEPDSDGPGESDEPSRPWYADPVGGVLVGAGAAGVLGGGVLMAVARRKAREAPNASIEDDYLSISQQARRMNAAGIVVLSLGSGLVIGGVIRYAVLASRGRGRTETVWRWRPAITATGIGVEGRF